MRQTFNLAEPVETIKDSTSGPRPGVVGGDRVGIRQHMQGPQSVFRDAQVHVGMAGPAQQVCGQLAVGNVDPDNPNTLEGAASLPSDVKVEGA